MPQNRSPPSYGSHHFGTSCTSSPSKVIAQPLLARHWQLDRSFRYKFIRWHIVTEAGLRVFLAKKDLFWKVRASIYYVSSVFSYIFPSSSNASPIRTVSNTYSSAIPYFENCILQIPSALPPTKHGHIRSWLLPRRILDWDDSLTFRYWLTHPLRNLLECVRNSLTSQHFCWQINIPVAGLIGWFASQSL